MINTHETSCDGNRDFTLCRGCYLYYSAKGGCTSDNGCWMARAKPYGKGEGRQRYDIAVYQTPLQRANAERQAERQSKQSLIDKDRFLELYHSDMSDRAIAREMGFSPNLIRRFRIDLGLAPYKRGRKKAATDAGTSETAKDNYLPTV